MSAFVLIATLAAAASQAPAPAPAAPPAAPADTVETIVVEGQVPVIGDLQKGVLDFQPSFFAKVAPTTALDMIQWLPGFAFADTRDMRGLENAGGNVLIDGKPPTSKTDTLQMVLRRIPSEQVERVDLIVGGAPGIDMHGWPVIANVILKKSATRRKTITVLNTTNKHGRDAPALSVSSASKTDARTLEASLEAGQTLVTYPPLGDGTWTRTDETGAVVFTADPRSVYDGPYAIGSAAYEQPLAGGRLRLNASGRYNAVDYYEQDFLTSAPGEYRYTHTQDYLQGELGLGYERPLGTKTTLDTQFLERPTHLTVDNALDRPPQPSVLDKLVNQDEHVLRMTLRYKPSDKLTLESAAEGDLNTYDTRNSETLNRAPFALPNAVLYIHEDRAEAGETVSWKPGGKVSLDGFLKVETSSLVGQGDTRLERDFTYFKPRMVLTWSPDKNTQLRLRGEHEVGQINFNDFAAGSDFNTGAIYAGNPQIRPQRDWVGEAVAERRFWTGGDLSLTFRRMHVLDLVNAYPLSTPTGIVQTVANIGNGTETDLVANLTLPLKRLGLEGGTLKGVLTWSQSSVIDPVTGLARRFSAQSPVVAELHFAEDLPVQKLNLGFDAFYNGPVVYYQPLGNQTLGAWARINLFVEYRASVAWNLRAELDALPGTRLHQTIDAFSGLRDASPLLYHDDQHLGAGPTLFIRIRRTFI